MSKNVADSSDHSIPAPRAINSQVANTSHYCRKLTNRLYNDGLISEIQNQQLQFTLRYTGGPSDARLRRLKKNAESKHQPATNIRW